MRSVDRSLCLLFAAALVAGCGTPGGDSADNTKKADEAKKNSAKVDVAKAGDVTLTVWDQEVRGGQAKQIKQLNKAFQAKYPNVKIKRVAKSFTDLNTTLKLAVSGPKAPDVVRGQPGPPGHGPARQGRAAAAARRLRGRLRLGRPLVEDAAGPQHVLVRRQAVRLRRTSTASRRWARSSASSTTRTRSPTLPKTFDEFEAAARQGQGSRATSRSRSATSTSSAASTSSRPSRTSSPTSRRCATSCSPSDGASFDTPENQAGGDEAPGVGRQGLLHAGLQRHRLRPGVAAVRQGQGPVPDRRHVGHRRPRRRDGRQASASC